MTFPIRHKLISLFFSPWFPFSVFLLAHTLLSHFPLDWKSKFWISIGGLFIPFFLLLLLNHPHPPEEQKNLKEKLDMIFPSFFWILLLLAAIFERFYRLTTLSTWPLADEGYLGGFAVELSEKWKWHLLYGYVQFPPLHFWCLGLFFKIFGPSLRNLWLFPALLSLLTLPLVYLASRRFFPKSLCVVMTAFWAFGFWPLFLDRLCLPQGLLVLWQLAAFIALGHFLRQETPSSKKWSAFILGFLTGTGFYTLLHWAFMAFWTALIVGYHTFQKAFKQPEPFLFFLFPVILFPLPLLVVFLTGKHGSYLHHVSIFNHDFSWQYQIRIWWNYLCGLFWGVQTGQYNYKPIWGGFLNPVAGSLFSWGSRKFAAKSEKE